MHPPHIANLNIVQDTQAHAAPVTLRRGIKQATYVIHDGDGISDGGQGLKYNFSHIFSIIYVYIFLLSCIMSYLRGKKGTLELGACVMVGEPHHTKPPTRQPAAVRRPRAAAA